jgi:hypothetical protein
LLGAPGVDRIFHVVSFIVVANALVPGATVAWVTRPLGLQKAGAGHQLPVCGMCCLCSSEVHGTLPDRAKLVLM